MKQPNYVSQEFLRYCLKEDIGRGDITSALIFDRKSRGEGVIAAKEPLVVCGSELVPAVYRLIDDTLECEIMAADGTNIEKGDIIAKVIGSYSSILTGERTVLNFLQRLSGIASLSFEYANAVAEGSGTKITDTRKTTPGWRTLEKYAVKTGGVANHRFGLDDGVMIKDNHIAAAGSITEAVKKVRAGVHHLLKIEVEVTNMDEVKEALESGADVIMLDNMSKESMAEAISLIGKKAVTEISGGVTLESIPDLSKLGADFISVGALTHSAVAKDINLTVKKG
jgi:nicotinate-nucleotide pyrophosphorylase (carboxylating)